MPLPDVDGAHCILPTPLNMYVVTNTAEQLAELDPILPLGYYGLETDTFLIKIGDGVTPWTGLRYLNKLNPDYFIQNDDGMITVSEAFIQLLDSFIKKDEPIEQLIITNAPTLPQEIANKAYVDSVIEHASFLKRRIVNVLPNAAEADENTMAARYRAVLRPLFRGAGPRRRHGL